jgi:hypothetical protein
VGHPGQVGTPGRDDTDHLVTGPEGGVEPGQARPEVVGGTAGGDDNGERRTAHSSPIGTGEAY